MKTRIFVFFLLAISLVLLWSSNSLWAFTIQSDTLSVTVNPETARVEISQKKPAKVLAQDLSLGSILLPDSTQPIEISKEAIPSLTMVNKGTRRVDLSLPIQKKAFHLTLEVQANSLRVVFDTKPIQDTAYEPRSFLQKEESLALLQAPVDFREVVLLPDLIRITNEVPGQLVFPYQEGTLIDFSHDLTEERHFGLFENNGLTMPFWGVSSPTNSVIGIVDYLYMNLAYQTRENSRRLAPRFFPDPYKISIHMQFKFLGENRNYIDIAKAYRNHLQNRNELPSLREKLQRKPQLIHLLEGVNIKFPIYMLHEQRPNAEGVTPPPREHNYQSFEDVVEVLKDMKKQGVDRLMAVWWGWGKDGYDRLHPDLLPPNPRLGGVETFKQMNQEIQQLGYAVGFHDNYTDIYEAAPSFDNGAHCTVGADGQNLKGGFWAGGQCWLLCSTEGLRFAQQNFKEMENYGPIHACFIDVLTAAPLFDCFSPIHPHTKWGDMKNKRAMMELVDRHFGIMGTEHGFSWGADLCDYFEGVIHDPNTDNEWFSGFGSSIPLFAAVYHDGVVLYPHQAARVTSSAPDRFLFDLRAGGSCYYNITRRDYEDPEKKEYFLRTYGVASNTIKRTWPYPLTQHAFLTDDRSVEQCTYGDSVTIVINRSDQDFQGELNVNGRNANAQATPVHLAPHGFLVAAPDYTALYGSEWGSFKADKVDWYEFQPSSSYSSSGVKEIRIEKRAEDQIEEASEEEAPLK